MNLINIIKSALRKGAIIGAAWFLLAWLMSVAPKWVWQGNVAIFGMVVFLFMTIGREHAKRLRDKMRSNMESATTILAHNVGFHLAFWMLTFVIHVIGIRNI